MRQKDDEASSFDPRYGNHRSGHDGSRGICLAGYGKTDPNVKKGLAQARQSTAKYHDVNKALANGYLPTEHCIAVLGVGGLGFHYVNPALIGDPAVDPLKPEVLLYAPKNNGELKLVGVEYLVVDADQDLATDEDRPDLFGVSFNGPMEATSRVCRCTTTCTPGSSRAIPMESLRTSTPR